MASLTRSQLKTSSNSTFDTNGVGGITAGEVRTFNDDLIDSLITNDLTSSMVVLSASFATSASSVNGQTLTSLNQFTASQDTKNTTLASYTGSNDATNTAQNSRLTNLENKSASVDISITNINQFTASNGNTSLNQFTASANNRLNSLEAATSSYAISSSVAAVDAAQQSQIDSLIAASGSYLTSSTSIPLTSLNSFTSSQYVSNSFFATTGSNTFRGDQIISGSGTYALNANGDINITPRGPSTSTGVELRASNSLTRTAYINFHSGDIWQLSSGKDGIREFQLQAASFPVWTVGITGSFDFMRDVDISGSLTASLQQGYAWVGNSNGVSVAVATSSFGGGGGSSDLTSLNAFTASQDTKNSTLGLYTASVDQKFSNIGGQSGSWDNTNLNDFTASQNTKNSTLATYTGSNDTKWSNLGSQSGSFVTDSESGSFLITASVNLNTITFTKGDTSTFNITVNTGSVQTTDITSLNAFTASQDTKNSTLANVTASLNASTASQQSQIDNLIAATGSYITTPLTSLNSFTASQDTKNSTLASVTASLQQQLTNIGGQSGSWITESETASFARTNVDNNFTANQTFTNITAVSASFQYVQTTYETSSVIYSSGSNQLGDELTDIQTLSGSVKVQGSLTINGTPVQTGSLDITSLNAFTQSQDTKNATLGTYTASVNVSLTNINSFTASQNTINSNVGLSASLYETKFATIGTQSGSWENIPLTSLNSFTQSQDTKNSTLAIYTASVNVSLSNINNFTSSQNSINTNLANSASLNNTKWDNIASQSGSFIIESETGSFARTGSNTFFGPQFISGTYYGDYTSSNWPTALVVSGGIFPYGDNMFDIGSDEHSFNKIVVNGELKGSSLNTNGRGRVGTLAFTNESLPLGVLDNREIVGSGQDANTHMYYGTSSSNPAGLREFAYIPSGSGMGADMNAFSASVAVTIGSIVTGTGFATTGSNTFFGSQFISGNVDISGSLTASLQQGYVWVGDVNGKTTTVSTSSFGGGGGSIDTGSFATTGSNAFSGSNTFNGNFSIITDPSTTNVIISASADNNNDRKILSVLNGTTIFPNSGSNFSYDGIAIGARSGSNPSAAVSEFAVDYNNGPSLFWTPNRGDSVNNNRIRFTNLNLTQSVQISTGLFQLFNNGSTNIADLGKVISFPIVPGTNGQYLKLVDSNGTVGFGTLDTGSFLSTGSATTTQTGNGHYNFNVQTANDGVAIKLFNTGSDASGSMAFGITDPGSPFIQLKGKAWFQFGTSNQLQFQSFTSSYDNGIIIGPYYTSSEKVHLMPRSSSLQFSQDIGSGEVPIFTLGTYNGVSQSIFEKDLRIKGQFTASLQQGYAWVGNASGISTLVATSSFGGGGGTTFSNPNLQSNSGSLVLIANTFNSGSANLSHISASAQNQSNLVFKNNNNTGTTIISGSNNIFTNPNTPTTGYIRYVGGANNIYLNSSNGVACQITASAISVSGVRPVMNNNIFQGNADFTINQAVNASTTAYAINGNYFGGANATTINALAFTGSNFTITDNIFKGGVVTINPASASLAEIAAGVSGSGGSGFEVFRNMTLGNGTMNINIGPKSATGFNSFGGNIINSAFTVTNISSSANVVASTNNANQAQTYSNAGAANLGLHRQAGNMSNNYGGMILIASASAIAAANNISTQALTVTNRMFSGSLGSGSLTYGNNINNGGGATYTITGSFGGTGNAAMSNNIVNGGNNTIFTNVEGRGNYVGFISNVIGGVNLILTGSNNNAITASGGGYFGRFNADDGIRNQSAENIFFVGTGTSASNRKTGFLIDSGSNSYFEGSLNVSGSTRLSGSLYIQSASAFPTQIGTSLVTWDATTGQVGQATTATLISSSFSAGEFYSMTTLSGSSGVSASIALPNTAISNGVSIQNDSQIVVQNNGTYNIQFSAQCDAFSNADTIWIWFKKNGTNITDSASKLIMQNNTAAIMTVNIFDNAVPNDYYEVVWQNNAGHAKITSDAATGNIPGIPSVIVTVNQVK